MTAIPGWQPARKSWPDTRPAIRAGETLTCPNGHVIARFASDLNWGDFYWDALRFEPRASVHPPQRGMHGSKCVCAQCGAYWFFDADWPFYMNGERELRERAA